MQELFAATNAHVAEVAAAHKDSSEGTWRFFCECGCREQVILSLAEYEVLRQAGTPVLVGAHLPADAERMPRELGQEAHALRAQARLQAARRRRPSYG